MPTEPRLIHPEVFGTILEALVEVQDIADRLKRDVEHLDPVIIHRELERIASTAVIIGMEHLRATPEDWWLAAKALTKRPT
jgi:hypothetical protein